jgi:hypothetical protein
MWPVEWTNRVLFAEAGKKNLGPEGAAHLAGARGVRAGRRGASWGGGRFWRESVWSAEVVLADCAGVYRRFIFPLRGKFRHGCHSSCASNEAHQGRPLPHCPGAQRGRLSPSHPEARTCATDAQRASAQLELRGIALPERIGNKRVAVGVARKPVPRKSPQVARRVMTRAGETPAPRGGSLRIGGRSRMIGGGPMRCQYSRRCWFPIFTKA